MDCREKKKQPTKGCQYPHFNVPVKLAAYPQFVSVSLLQLKAQVDPSDCLFCLCQLIVSAAAYKLPLRFSLHQKESRNALDFHEVIQQPQ